MNTINENVKKDSLKSTSMRLSEQTLKALKDVAKNENLPNQDSAIKWLLASATFAKASDSLPERSQTLCEIQELFSRIMSKIEENFNLMADIQADSQNEVANKELELNAKICELEKQLRDKDIQIQALKEAFASVGSVSKESKNDIINNNSDAT